MIYWFSNFPDDFIEFPYSKKKYDEDCNYLNNLIETILQDTEFFLTEDKRNCSYCVYRSLCDRGIEASSLDDNDLDEVFEENIELDFDFDQIGEIEF